MIVHIFCPIYIRIDEEDLKKAIKFYIRRLISDLSIARLEVRGIHDRYIQLLIEGDEAEIAKNYLVKIMGTRLGLADVLVGKEYSGRVHRVGRDNIYIDIGTEPPIYVEIEKQVFLARILGRRTPKQAIEHVLKITGISKNFPLATKIINKAQRGNTECFIGIPGRRTIAMYRRWLRDRLDRVIVYGALRSHLDKKLRKSGLHRKIINIERLGLLEHSVVCRFGEFADEVAQKLMELGVPRVAVFMPRRIRKIINYYSKIE